MIIHVAFTPKARSDYPLLLLATPALRRDTAISRIDPPTKPDLCGRRLLPHACPTSPPRSRRIPCATVGLHSEPAMPEPPPAADVRPLAIPSLLPALSVVASDLHIGDPAPQETAPEPAG